MERPEGTPIRPVVVEPDLYAIPQTVVSAAAWTDTGEILGGASSGRRVQSEKGRAGIRKPGDPVAGSEEAFREIIAVRIARWLGVSVPEGELFQHEGKPCFVSFDLGPTALKWGTVMDDPVGIPHRDKATAALQRHAGIIALDALVGAVDRSNAGNHLYVPTEDRWYGIDYGFSFNMSGQKGIGDCNVFTTPYFPAMIEAIRIAPARLEAALKLAECIPDKKIEALCALPPALFATPEVRAEMLGFLTSRQANLRPILQEWCKMMTLDGILNDAKS